jgi:glycosyltransferase involved in cell wall biosynthesis
MALEHEVEIFYLEDRTDRELLDFSVPTKKLSLFSNPDFSDFDIVHSHTIKADLFVAFHRKSLRGVKTVTTLHNYAGEDLIFSYGTIKGKLLLWLWQWATAKHDRIVVLSRHAQTYYQKHWKDRVFEYVYNGVACPSSAHSHVQSQAQTEYVRIGAIASAGGLNRRKGIDQIIRALAKLPGYELHIAGKKTEESVALEVLAKEYDVAERVYFLGYVSDMAAFIADIDFFVVASRSEGFGLALQEIACMKKPLICSNIPVFQEIFGDDEVRFFELENIESLAQAIDGFEKAGMAYAQKAYRRYLSEYTPQKMVENYLKIYKELTE